jgi:hypothetical protein
MSSRDTLELVKVYSEAQRATADAEKRLQVAENAKRPNQKNITKLQKELDLMKIAEDEAFEILRTTLAKLEMTSNPSETARPFQQSCPALDVEDDGLSSVAADDRTARQNVQIVPVMSANRQVAINPPDKYKHGDDFTMWGARFKRYVRMAGISDEQSLWTLLNQVDDRTAEKLDPVCESLTPAQRRDPELYLPILEKSIYPVTQSKTLRVQLTQMKQEDGETVDDFAVRIRKMGNKIWRSQITGGPGDELCYSVFLAGLRQNEIRKDVMKLPGVNQFEQAVKAAVETENILLSSRPKVVATDSQQVPVSILQVGQSARDNRSDAQNRSRPREQGSRQQGQNNFMSRNDGNRGPRVSFDDNSRQRGNFNYRARDHSNTNQRAESSERNSAGTGNGGRRFRNVECYRCGRLGHISRFCRDRLNSQRAGPSTGPYQPQSQ